MKIVKTSYELVSYLLSNELDLTAPEHAVLCVLASHSNPDNKEPWTCWPSLDKIMKVSRFKKNAVINATKGLVCKGLVSVQKGDSLRGVSNIYTINVCAILDADTQVDGSKDMVGRYCSTRITEHSTCVVEEDYPY